MKKIVNILAVTAVVLSVLFVPKPVFADGCANGIQDGDCNKICSSGIDEDAKKAAGCTIDTGDTVPGHIKSIIDIAITVVGILAVVVIVMGGQRYITSSGDPQKIKAAKDMILYAVIALIIAGLAYAIITFVAEAVGK